MVEFALLAPVLLLIVLGILYFGRFLNYTQDETHIANLGARWAAVNTTTPAGCTLASLQACIQAQANGELAGGSTDVTNAGGSQGAQVCIDFPNGTSQIGDPVRVTVQANFHFVPLLGIGTISVPEVAVMRLEATNTNYSAGCSP